MAVRWSNRMKMDREFRKRIAEYQEKSRQRDAAVHLNRVTVDAVEGFYARAKARGFEFCSDEPREGGGENKAPRPLEYFLGGFAFCQQAQYAKYAALRGLEITDLRIDVRGYVDQRGILGIEEVPPGFQRIDYVVKIESPEPPALILNLVTTVEAVCPAHAAIRGNTPLNRTLLVNGQEQQVPET